MISEAFSYEKPKVIQALRYHFISRKEIRIMLVLVNVFAILAAILFYMKKVNATAFFTSTIVWLILMLLVWYYLPFHLYKSSRTFKDEFAVRLDDEGFALMNEKTQRQWEWPSITQFVESPHFFHIYFGSQSFFLVPKTAFLLQDVNKAREILKRNTRAN